MDKQTSQLRQIALASGAMTDLANYFAALVRGSQIPNMNDLQRLGWVEPNSQEALTRCQDTYAEHQSRVFIDFLLLQNPDISQFIRSENEVCLVLFDGVSPGSFDRIEREIKTSQIFLELDRLEWITFVSSASNLAFDSVRALAKGPRTPEGKILPPRAAEAFPCIARPDAETIFSLIRCLAPLLSQRYRICWGRHNLSNVVHRILDRWSANDPDREALGHEVTRLGVLVVTHRSPELALSIMAQPFITSEDIFEPGRSPIFIFEINYRGGTYCGILAGGELVQLADNQEWNLGNYLLYGGFGGEFAEPGEAEGLESVTTIQESARLEELCHNLDGDFNAVIWLPVITQLPPGPRIPKQECPACSCPACSRLAKYKKWLTD